MNPITVLIALENHEDATQIAQSFAESTINANIAIRKQSDLIQTVLILKPDFVIVEELKGFEWTRIIKSTPQLWTKCIVCFRKPTEEILISAIFANADAYFSLDTQDQSMPDCIKRLRAGERYITPALIPQFIKHDKADNYQKLMEPLTRQEKEVFRLLGYNNRIKDIADKLFISAKTVEAHKNNIISKLSLSGSAELRKVATQTIYSQ
jgi:DNA-binding NarL/FixJ family response regulator